LRAELERISKTLATNKLFMVNQQSEPPPKVNAWLFHHLFAKLLYPCMKSTKLYRQLFHSNLNGLRDQTQITIGNYQE